MSTQQMMELAKILVGYDQGQRHDREAKLRISAALKQRSLSAAEIADWLTEHGYPVTDTTVRNWAKSVEEGDQGHSGSPGRSAESGEDG